MVDSQALTITSLGITKTAAELINQRIFDSSQVTLVGDILTDEDGTALSFNSDSYVYYTGLELSSATNLRVKFAGNFNRNSADTLQCCWSLVSPVSPSNNISFCMKSDSIVIFKGATQEFIADNLHFTTNDYINVDFTFSRMSYSIIVKHDAGSYSFNGTWTDSVSMDAFREIIFGWTSINNSYYYWNDSISLSNFVLYKNDQVYYSPSKDSFINFSKIMISDGTYPLTDSSSPLLNHVYEIAIKDINRTANTVVVKAEIESNVYLKIVELGLYVQTEEGKSALFGIVKGLSVNKTSGLDYDLLFKVDLSISVVNAFIVPNIIIKDTDFISLADILNIERVHTNVTSDLERAITNNATLLGYARPLSVNAFLNLHNEYPPNSLLFMNAINECQRNTAIVEKYKVLKKDKALFVKDFYEFSGFPYEYSLYYSYNLSGLPESRIKYLEGYLIGNRDSIDFSNQHGFTLAINTQLRNVNDKMIIAKMKSSQDIYLTLELNNFSLSFKLYTLSDTISLVKTFSTLDFQNIIKNSYLITIVLEIKDNAFNFKMYGGNEVIAETSVSSLAFKHPLEYKITNYLGSGDIPEENYVKNIVSFDSSLSASDVVFLNTILGSNT